eukprot:6498223-Pyramimonas_sp.AAC.1
MRLLVGEALLELEVLAAADEVAHVEPQHAAQHVMIVAIRLPDQEQIVPVERQAVRQETTPVQR